MPKLQVSEMLVYWLAVLKARSLLATLQVQYRVVKK